MPLLMPLKNDSKEKTLFTNRVVLSGLLISISFVLLILRLSFLQIAQHSLYSAFSQNNQIRVVPITPKRGLIYDRQGELLAGNKTSYDLELIPIQVKALNKTLEILENIIPLSEEEKSDFFKQLKNQPRHQSATLKRKLSEKEVARFMAKKYQFSGLQITPNLIRHYPHGNLFAHAIGYVAPMNEQEAKLLDPAHYRNTHHVGKTGLEKFYETHLHGKIGYHHVETDAKGRNLRKLKTTPAIPGSNLYLSLDLQLQKLIYQKLGKHRGAVVALNPKTGDILAFASNPSFDPNIFTEGMDYATYKQLKTASDKPLFNRAIIGQYPPGSTIKPIIALKALEHGIVSTRGQFFDPGWFQMPGDERFYHDWKREGHGWVNLEMAIYQSCSTFFYYIAHHLGIDKLENIFTQFGLGQLPEIDIFGAAKGLVPSKKWKRQAMNQAWFPGETLSVGIGQGYMLSTPLQIAQMAAAISQRGDRYKPHLVHAIRPPFTDNYALIEPELIDSIALNNPSFWDFIHQAMQKTIAMPEGTAHGISYGLRYSLAGKTGTAQVFSLKEDEAYESHKLEEKLRDHGWFMGFAPVENPEIALCVLIENAKGASRVARSVLDHYFKEIRTHVKS